MPCSCNTAEGGIYLGTEKERGIIQKLFFPADSGIGEAVVLGQTYICLYLAQAKNGGEVRVTGITV